MAVKDPFSQEFRKLRRHYIREGERIHESLLALYPHRLRLLFTEDLDHNCDRMGKIEEYLSTRLAEGTYAAFPGTAIGKYKEDIYCVFFQNLADALMMKLTL